MSGLIPKWDAWGLRHATVINYAICELLISLRQYSMATNRGVALENTATCLINEPYPIAIRTDAAYHTGEMLGDHYIGPPLLAIYVRESGDYGRRAEDRIAARRTDLFTAGTQVVWDVDIVREELVRVYRANNPNTPHLYVRGDIAHAEPALPGWQIPVEQLFCTPRK